MFGFAEMQISHQMDIHGGPPQNPSTGDVVHWRSSEQSLITKSTCESELLATNDALEQSENIGLQFAEINPRPRQYEVSSENSAACAVIFKGPENRWRTRHIAVKGTWLDQRSEFGTQLAYLETKHMIADSLAKGIGANKLPQIRNNLRLLDYCY